MNYDLPHAERLLAYEREKAAWIEGHPEATPAEYQAAMTAIAQRAGV